MTAIIHTDKAVCPVCKKLLCRVDRDAAAHGIKLWCRMCRAPVMLELQHVAVRRDSA